MFLNKLSLLETDPEIKEIRTIKFKKGMNYIVDAGVDQKKGNGVGKTTFLKLIDICMGARDRKYIYTNFDTGNINSELKDYISTSKIRVELELIDSFEKVAKQVNLGVDLFSKGRRYINGEKYGYNDYKKKLNEIIFDNEQDRPSFREMIGMFVRINQKKDITGFLKYKDKMQDDAYRLAYSFFFDLGDQKTESKIFEISQEIKSQKKSLKEFKNINNIKSLDAITQKIVLITQDIEETQEQLSVLVDTKKFLENEQKVNEIKADYADVNNQLDQVNYKLKRTESILEDAKAQQMEAVDLSVLQDLYDETSYEFGHIDKTFQELVRFNEELTQNKLDYFTRQLAKWYEKESVLSKVKRQLFEQHKGLIMLIEDNKIEQYTELQSSLGEYQEELGKNKQIFSTYERLNEMLSRSQEAYARLNDKDKSSDGIGKFNKYFSDYSKKLNGTEYLLFKSDTTFPVDIQQKNSKGLSTGTKKSLMAAFDLAYQSYAKSISKNIPNFIVHDLVEVLDNVSFNGLIDIVNKENCQFIVSVLMDKVSRLSNFSDSDVRLTLSETDLLFKK